MSWYDAWKEFFDKFDRVRLVRYSLVISWFALFFLVISSWGGEPNGLRHKLWFDTLGFLSPTWQQYGIIVLAVGLILYKDEIRGLIRRIKRLPGGIEIDVYQAKVGSPGGLDKESSRGDESQGSLPFNSIEEKSLHEHAAIAKVIEDIRLQIENSYSDLSDSQKYEKALFVASIEKNNRDFEFVFRYIYKTQIHFLQMLRANKMHFSYVGQLYLSIQNSNVFYSGFSFEQYARFLFDNLLIERHGEDLCLTAKGDLFLVWLSQVKYNINERPN